SSKRMLLPPTGAREGSVLLIVPAALAVRKGLSALAPRHLAPAAGTIPRATSSCTGHCDGIDLPEPAGTAAPARRRIGLGTIRAAVRAPALRLGATVGAARRRGWRPGPGRARHPGARAAALRPRRQAQLPRLAQDRAAQLLA